MATSNDSAEAQGEDGQSVVNYILEHVDEWRADLLIEDPHKVGKECVKKLRIMVRLRWNSMEHVLSDQSVGDALFLFFLEVNRVVRMIGQAHGIRGAELVNADASIRYNAWEDLLAAVTAKDSLPQWSAFRTPQEWRTLLGKAGKASSESTWRTYRKTYSHQMNGDNKSVRVTRALADQWGLKLPEFTEGTRN